MPASTDGRASVTRAGEALCFAGVLSRDTVPALWSRLLPLEGVTTLDLSAVDSVDSAGLALLAEVASKLQRVAIVGTPDGLAALGAAYRLGPDLEYANG